MENKIKLFYCIGLLLFISSCSEEEPVKNELEDIRLSFATREEIIDLPEGLINSTDPYAQTAYGYATSANLMSAYFNFFAFPDGATKTTNRIVPANARTTATGEYLVYTWTDPQVGGIAYQLGDIGDRYSFEVFFQRAGSTQWLRYLYAEEKKDQSNGFMKVFDIDAANASAAVIEYTWTVANGSIVFRYNFLAENEPTASVVITVNESTQAGKVEYFVGTALFSRITWDALGNGTWEEYDEEGVLLNEGSWTAGA